MRFGEDINNKDKQKLNLNLKSNFRNRNKFNKIRVSRPKILKV